MKNFYFATYKSDLDIAVFKTVEERDAWLKGKDIIPAGDPILAEEREALTIEDVRMSLLPINRAPLTDDEIIEYISKNAQPDEIVEGVMWIMF